MSSTMSTVVASCLRVSCSLSAHFRPLERHRSKIAMGCDQCAAPLHRQLVNHSPHCRCHGELLVNLHQADLHAQVRSKRHLLTECVDYDRQAELEVLVKLIANAEERKRERLERYRAQGGSPFERLPQDCVARIVSMLLEEAEDVDWQRWPFVEQEGAHDHHHQLKRRRQLRRTCPPATMALWSEACRLDYRVRSSSCTKWPV